MSDWRWRWGWGSGDGRRQSCLASTIFELPFLNFECQQMQHRMQLLVLVICL